jgi:hypothetical protein
MPSAPFLARRRIRPTVAPPLRLCLAGAAVLLFVLAAPANASGAQRHHSSPLTRPQAESAIPPRITAALRNLATRTTWIRLRARYKEWSDDEVVILTRRIVRKWVVKKAKECPDPLPKWFFCSRPPQQWGRGVALGIGGNWAGEFRSPWSPYNPPRMLRPGFVFWLTCWSKGAVVDNGVYRSNFWYRLTNGLWVSDAWLYTGSNYPLRGVANCPAR